MKRKQIIKLLIESGLIVFSVLFALFIDRMAANARTNDQKRTAVKRIHQELLENEKLIQRLINRHDTVIYTLNTAIRSPEDALRHQIARDGYLDYHLLANGKSLFPRYPSSTAWDAAKSTGIISEFDYETIEACEGAYALQQIIVNNTLPKIVDDLFDLDVLQMGSEADKIQNEVYRDSRAGEDAAAAVANSH